MLKKRIIGTILVKGGLGVQSFGYNRWLPLGKPTVLAENLDRWGADGIAVLCLDRKGIGPDVELIEAIGKLGLTTPFTYGGGLMNEQHARSAVSAGAERLIIDTVLSEDIDAVYKMANAVGIQALVASIPLIKTIDNETHHWIHTQNKSEYLKEPIIKLLREETVSEILLIDAKNEGLGQGYNTELVSYIGSLCNLPILAFGGMANSEHIRSSLQLERITGILLGNCLNYGENRIKKLKDELIDMPLRTHPQEVEL